MTTGSYAAFMSRRSYYHQESAKGSIFRVARGQFQMSFDISVPSPSQAGGAGNLWANHPREARAWSRLRSEKLDTQFLKVAEITGREHEIARQAGGGDQSVRRPELYPGGFSSPAAGLPRSR